MATADDSSNVFDSLKELYAKEGKTAVQSVMNQMAEYMAPKCGKCGQAIYEPILWHVETDDFKGIACSNCQRQLLDRNAIYFDRYGNVWE
jgi:DNA-directed RNA polymerase subunit RPC12/RpoP